MIFKEKSCELLIFCFVCAVFTAASLFAQTPSGREESNVYGRPGWVLENGRIRVGLLRGGGHIAEVRLISTNPRLSINPLFIPEGNGYMGHLVCFPHYGPASAEERAQGLRGHGEAGSVEWQQTRPPQIDAQGITFFYGADLPKTQYKIERAVTVNAGDTVVHVEEWIENLAPYARPQCSRYVGDARHNRSDADRGRKVGAGAVVPVAGRAAS